VTTSGDNTRAQLGAWVQEEECDMSAAAVLGMVLIIGFVGVALVAAIVWRKRMQESMPYGGWRQSAQDDAAPSSEWNKDARAAARLTANVKEICS